MNTKNSKTFIYVIATGLILLFSVFIPRALFAATERIISFTSDITVNTDATLAVTETITVESAGTTIKRGIYRDFPTSYKDRYGNKYVLGFEVREVLRDGRKEPYHIENQANGKRVYIGKSDVFLSPGIYTYTLAYTATRELGFFKDHDELYWNVTGNGWAFPIEYAQARVRLPVAIPSDAVETIVFTGPYGAIDKNATVSEKDGAFVFSTTLPLAPEEGLTIGVSWPKGYVQESTSLDKWRYFARDNLSTALALAGLLAVTVYYLIAWSAVGRDPQRGTIIPLYEPPGNLSGAAIRYVYKMRFDDKTLAAAVVGLAAKGFLSIKEQSSGTEYTLIKKEKIVDGLTSDETAFLDALFAKGGQVVALAQTNYKKIQKIKTELRVILKSKYRPLYFRTNTEKVIPGALLSLATIGAVAAKTNSEAIPLFIVSLIFTSIWAFILVKICLRALLCWRLARIKFWPYGFDALALTVILIPALIILPSTPFYFLSRAPWLAFSMLALLAVNFLFYRLLKARTKEGRNLLDETLGFRSFLSVTEKERLNFHNPPNKTPELFEKFLPYAIALDVEHAWGEQFTEIFKQKEESGGAYHPLWYSGTRFSRLGGGGFAAGLAGAFTATISSSSHAPGSRSGFGGGGSSGGGGGGGGGGGW